jgi:hypothetical protein
MWYNEGVALGCHVMAFQAAREEGRKREPGRVMSRPRSR